jgi:RNA polymerase sigma-70 factor, ECF subfamily
VLLTRALPDSSLVPACNLRPMPDLYRVMGETDVPTGSREQRFSEVFSACYGPVLAFARRRLEPELAKDAVAETFVTAWRRLDELSGDPMPWLYRMASNAIANQRRGLARRQRLDERAQLLADPSAVPDHAESVVETDRLAAAFQSLSEADQEVLRLVTWDGLDHRAAASVLGCSAATFKVRLHRARNRLSGLLAPGEAGRNPGTSERASIPWEETTW